jgi:SAM-dependent methyltransferase
MEDEVEQNYDEIAENYLASKDDQTVMFAKKLEERLSDGAKILDAGCGPGIPIAKYLSENFDVLGIDISAKQIELASKLVPNAKFRKMDMLDLGNEFDPGFFDGIICMYSIFHINRKKHLEILKEFYRVLKSPGYLMICMGLEDNPEQKNEWHGGKMFWSHYGREKNLELLKKAGYEIISEEAWNPPDDPNDRHLFVLCKK